MSASLEIVPNPESHAVCARHPDQRAIAPCSRCGTFVCYQCITNASGSSALCPDCVALTPPLASRGARFAANLVDQFIWVPWFFPMFLVEGEGMETLQIVFGIGGVIAALGTLVLQIYLAARGQSVGKKLLKIRVVRSDGSRASLARIIFLRNALPVLVNSLCGILNLVDAVMIFGNERRCIHDHMADTMVIEAREPV
ncbi:MAG: RDD family protein [Myxococcaceae bacterium]